MNKDKKQKQDDYLHHDPTKHKETSKNPITHIEDKTISGPSHVKSTEDKVETGIESHEQRPFY